MMKVSVGVLLLSLALFLAGCGGGSSSTSSERASSSSQDLLFSIALPSTTNQVLAQATTFRAVRVSLLDDATEQTRFTNQATVPAGANQVQVGLSAVNPGNYILLVQGFDQQSNVIAQARQPVSVAPTSATVVQIVLTLTTGTAPVAVDDMFTGNQDQTLTVNAAGGVISNDQSVNGNVALVTGPAQGTLTLAPDGGFQYVPPTGFSGTVTFTYELTDANGTDQGVATILVQATPLTGFFVRLGDTGTGLTPADPRGDLDGALADAVAGDVVFVFGTAGNYLPPVTDFVVPDGVRLIGEGVGLSNGGTVIVPANPTNTPVLEGRTVMGNNTLISGFNIVRGATPVGSGPIHMVNSTNVEVNNCEVDARGGGVTVNMTGASGEIRYIESELINNGGGGVGLTGNLTGEARLTLENSTLTGSNISANLTGASTNSLVRIANCNMNTPTIIMDVTAGQTCLYQFVNNTIVDTFLQVRPNASTMTFEMSGNSRTITGAAVAFLNFQPANGSQVNATVSSGVNTLQGGVQFQYTDSSGNVILENYQMLAPTNGVGMIAAGGANVGFRMENVTVPFRTVVQASGTADLRAAILGSTIGFSPTAGPLNRRLNVIAAATTTLCARISGNNISNALTVSNLTNVGVVDVTQVNTVNNIVDTPFVPPANVQDITAAQCVTP